MLLHRYLFRMIRFDLDEYSGSEAEAGVLSKNKHLFEIPIITNEHHLMPLMLDKFAATIK